MPALGMAQDTGKIVKWLKSEGDEVQKGEAIMEVETDKVTVEIESQGSGKLASVTAAEGEDIPVGQVIAYLLEPGETAPEGTTAPVKSPVPSVAPEAAAPAPAAPSPSDVSATPVAARIAAEYGIDLHMVKPDGGKISKSDVEFYLHSIQAPTAGKGQPLASPKARRLATERGIDLAGVRGSGPEGAVLTADILAIAPRTPAVSQELEMTTAWKIMAERLTQSWSQAPHIYLMREVNANRMVDWRESVLPQASIRISYTDILVKLVAAALSKHPRLHASWQQDSIQANSDINIGLAVAVESGLIVPVVHQADKLSLEEIAFRRDDIVKRANAGNLQPADIQGGNFTITNLGMYGIDVFTAVLNPPEAAILAVGRIVDKLIPVDGQPAVQPRMTLSLTCDHRVVDGARGAEFLQTLVGLIEEPLALLL